MPAAFVYQARLELGDTGYLPSRRRTRHTWLFHMSNAGIVQCLLLSTATSCP